MYKRQAERRAVGLFVAAGLVDGGYAASLTAVVHPPTAGPVSYTHLRAHETVLDLVCRLLLEKKNKTIIHDANRQLI